MRIPVVVAVACVLVLGWQYDLQAQLPFGLDKSKKAEESSVPNVTMTGRFQIFVSPNIKGATFMLDTDTGRVWIVKKDHKSGNHYLKRVSVEEVDKTAGSAKSDQAPSTSSKINDSAGPGGKKE
jgi:hypothetical protein